MASFNQVLHDAFKVITSVQGRSKSTLWPHTPPLWSPPPFLATPPLCDHTPKFFGHPPFLITPRGEGVWLIVPCVVLTGRATCSSGFRSRHGFVFKTSKYICQFSTGANDGTQTMGYCAVHRPHSTPDQLCLQFRLWALWARSNRHQWEHLRGVL